jgi:hypothetical protein
MKHVVGFSGGADSQATALWVRERFPAEDIILTNADPGGNEAPETTAFIEWYNANIFPVVMLHPEVQDMAGKEKRKIAELGLQPTDPLTFDLMALLSRRFPSTKARFCTTYLKLMPKGWHQREGLLSGLRGADPPDYQEKAGGHSARHEYQGDQVRGGHQWATLPRPHGPQCRGQPRSQAALHNHGNRGLGTHLLLQCRGPGPLPGVRPVLGGGIDRRGRGSPRTALPGHRVIPGLPGHVPETDRTPPCQDRLTQTNPRRLAAVRQPGDHAMTRRYRAEDCGLPEPLTYEELEAICAGLEHRLRQMTYESVPWLRAEIARIREERDRLAQWIHHREESDAVGTVRLVAVGLPPHPALAAALAEHDKKCTSRLETTP